MKKNYFSLFLVLFTSLVIPFYVEASDFKIHFIDVGKGDSILIQTPNDKSVLVDAGNFITGFKVVEYLKKYDIHNLDYLIFTHPDLDHIGGAFFVLQMMDVERIYDNGEDLTQVMQRSDIYRWYEELVRENNNYHIMTSGDDFVLDGVVFKVLWPHKPSIFSNFNANSLVIMIEYKKKKCLLTGDLTIPAEKELLNEARNLKADILKVGHHGNYDANCEEFLEVVSPNISVISVNKDNIRGYPSRTVLERLETLNTKIYRTDLHGDIVVDIKDNGEIKVNTNR